MSSQRSTWTKAAGGAAIAVALLGSTRQARAQACCAGASALTPGRLLLHEDALVGTQLHAGTVLGDYDANSHYAGAAPHNSEQDYEEDLFGAVRVLKRGQVALLVPLVETYRSELGRNEFGGGIGDVNLSLRYDFFLAGMSKIIPGVAVLAGITAPTGTPPDAQNPSKPLGTNATGIGAWQGNVGVALEQTYGPWLFNATELLAWRAARTADIAGVSESETLALQFVTLVGAAYTFPSEASVALFASYTVEGTATLNGAPAPDSARSMTVVSLSGGYPLTDHFRMQGSLFVNPPLTGFGLDQTATAGLTLTLVWGWS